MSLYDVISRGGWDLAFLSNVFVYLICSAVVIVRVGRVLAGWENGKITVYPPSLSPALKEENDDVKNKVATMTKTLFAKVTDKLDAQVIDILMATLLKNYNQCMLLYPQNIVYAKISQVARELDILSSMSRWSTLIEESFRADNLAARVATPDMTGDILLYMQSISSDLKKLREENTEMKRMISSIACNISSQPELKEIKEMTAELKQILLAVSASMNATDIQAAKRALTSPLRTSPPKKKQSQEKGNIIP